MSAAGPAAWTGGNQEDPGIRPNCAAYELTVSVGHMNSPQEPCVNLWALEDDGIPAGPLDQLTPAQARAYAQAILDAANTADPQHGHARDGAA